MRPATRDHLFSAALATVLLVCLLWVAIRDSPSGAHLRHTQAERARRGLFPLRAATSSSTTYGGSQPPPVPLPLRAWEQEGACRPPLVDWSGLQEHNCVLREKVCIDQDRFISFDKRLQPGKDFEEGAKLFDFGWTFTNLPGWPDNIKGTKRLYHPVMAQANSSHDPVDILHPSFQSCQVPLVWWPYFGMNAADVYLSSLLPLLRMQSEGIFDEGVSFVPVMDGWRLPHHFENFFAPFSRHQVQTLEELSDRRNEGRRCFEAVLMCHPYNFWFRSEKQTRAWDAGFKPKGVAAEIVRYHLPAHSWQPPESRSPGGAPASRQGAAKALQSPIQVLFIRRKTRLILNLDELLSQCEKRHAKEGLASAGVKCGTIEFEEQQSFADALAALQATNILVGVHGAGLINSFFLPPHASAFLEIFPCRFGSGHQDSYFLTPARKENSTLGFQMHLTNESDCSPSPLQAQPQALNYKEGPAFVRSTLDRDQDVRVPSDRLLAALQRIIPLLGKPEAYSEKLRQEPAYYDIPA